MTDIRMNITAEDLAPLQRTVREGSAMLAEALREAERLRNQTILCAGAALFICCALSLAAISRAGEGQDLMMTARCESALALALASGASPDDVRRWPQCRERLPAPEATP